MSDQPIIHIEQIRQELTWRLRQQVLYPQEPLSAMAMEEDDHGIHFGAFYNNWLVAVVSLFQHDTDFQFRKFAVDSSVQKKGIGRQLLSYIIEQAKTDGGTRLWCNARVSAIDFYKKSGFAVTGLPFSKNGFDYEIMELSLK